MLQTFPKVSSQTPSFFLSWSSLASGHGTGLRVPVSSQSAQNRRRSKAGRISCSSEELKTAVKAASKAPVAVKAVVTVNKTIGGLFAHIGLTRGLDDIGDLFGRSLLLELVSSELDEKSGKEKDTISAFAGVESQDKLEVKYEANFTVPKDFGEIGGVFVTNQHHTEMWVKDIVLTTSDTTTAITLPCRSWVHAKSDSSEKRFFFTNKSYLPSETPRGLVRLREKELQTMRGDGTGERQRFERIYDYDTYNDLGDPDKSDDLARPVLGGSSKFPYPRRCRTGRPRSKKDPQSETRSGDMYVPRDETFSEVKNVTFSTKTLRTAVRAVVPLIETTIENTKGGFQVFKDIDALFDEGLPLSTEDQKGFFTILPRIIKALEETAEEVLLFEPPAMFDRDKFSWFRDEEFSRQTLAGLNPYSIQLVTELPLMSKLDPKIYGPPESSITEELIEREIRGIMTAREALEQKRLFMLDYHDLLLPYVHKIREMDDATLYGSRTIFFLTPAGTLRPIAIELTRPPSPTKPQWKRVFLPCWDATGAWLWKLAKAHVCSHDSGYHQLVIHWLRTHGCMEPYIIAANRQLSAAHPIYRLLDPHFRYTMEINALAREYLISGDGIIETCFFPGKYSMELSSVAYGQLWRFDMESFPGDLIRRGMAVEDPTAEHGLRLMIEDYPFANDGLLIWSSIKEWVTDYVSHYYGDSDSIKNDSELQAWWTEVRTKGHADKKDEPWWPKLDCHANLVEVLCTIIWVGSGHHAAVNFGQYHYAGYFPNRPTTMRSNMPVEDEHDPAFARFHEKPENALLESLPTPTQATVVMTILDVLSNHSPDEEYLGEDPDPAWADEPLIRAAFERFNGRMKEIEGIIDARNVNPKLMNRCGAGIVPYELLKPFSKPGVTGMGVPNSISI